jgi:hypothetical protein
MEIHCQCGQAERQRRADAILSATSEPVVAPHTASCPVVLAESLDDINRQIAEAESAVPMFGADEHEARLDEMKARRDRLAKRLTPSGERGTIDPKALWYDGTSKMTNRSKPRTQLKGDGQ